MGDLGQTMPDPDCLEVVRLERLLLDPRVRRSPDLVRPLLHPDFLEFGASGRIWDTESVVAALASDAGGAEVTARDFAAVLLDPDVVLLTFRTDGGVGACLRSSVWVRSASGGWLLRFHQATGAPVARSRGKS